MGRWVRENWWIVVAALTGAMQVVLGVGLPFEDRTLGSVFGGILFATAGASMLAGIGVRRRRSRIVGDLMMAGGALPLMIWLWTVVLPLLALAVIIPAIVDAADAGSRGPAGPAEPPRDAVRNVLVALLLAVLVAAVVVGDATVAALLVSPFLALLVAHVVMRRATRWSGVGGVGATLVVAGLLNGVLQVPALLLLPDAATDDSRLLAWAAVASAAVTLVGLVLVTAGLRRGQGQARPA